MAAGVPRMAALAAAAAVTLGIDVRGLRPHEVTALLEGAMDRERQQAELHAALHAQTIWHLLDGFGAMWLGDDAARWSRALPTPRMLVDGWMGREPSQEGETPEMHPAEAAVRRLMEAETYDAAEA